MPRTKKTAKKKVAKTAKKKVTTKKVAAKKAAIKEKSARGTRYSSKQKATILLFVDKFNAKNGRGGAAEAARKYGITQLTISKWMKETGAPAPARKTNADFNKTIEKISDIHKNMASLQDQLDTLRKEYVELKGQL